MRVDRTLAFVDLCGFTDFVDTQGDHEAVKALSAMRRVIRSISSQHGVRVDKWMGDGAMIVALEPTPLLNALRQMAVDLPAAGCPLALRGGLTHGPVLLFEGDDYAGRTVNLAARLCDLAEPGEILTTPDVVDAEPTTPAGLRDVKGFAEPIEVVALVV